MYFLNVLKEIYLYDCYKCRTVASHTDNTYICWTVLTNKLYNRRSWVALNNQDYFTKPHYSIIALCIDFDLSCIHCSSSYYNLGRIHCSSSDYNLSCIHCGSHYYNLIWIHCSSSFRLESNTKCTHTLFHTSMEWVEVISLE